MTSTAQQWSQVTSSMSAWFLTFAIAACLPLLGFILFRRLVQPSGSTPSSRKRQIYISVILLEWIIVSILWVLFRSFGLRLDDIGENFGHALLTIILTTALLLLLGIMVFANVRKIRQMTVPDLEKELGRLKRLMPNDSYERFLFLMMAVTAGVCEEIIYRGWMQNLFSYTTGSVWIGLMIAAVLFGLGHAYQGKMGMLQTGFIGLILGVVFIFTSSLICVQVIHAAIDVLNGLVGGSAVSRLNSENTTQERNLSPS